MRLSGKVALITGAAQSQGRSHAVRLAAEGTDIIAVDICRQIDFVPYAMGTEEGLAETARLVEKAGRRVYTARADVRDAEGLAAAVEEGVAELGRLDIVSANASIATVQPHDEITPEIWQTTLDINLTGVWHTCAAAIPHLVAAGGGSIVITGSSAALKGLPFYLPYVAAKHALVGLARSLALELADRNIRVNTIHPTGVDTPQGHSAVLPELLEARPDLGPLFMNSLPVPRIEAIDVSNALVFLASDEARYVTGAAFPIDAGSTIR
ncbi:mycofactocin-coupled SDR family oxidoreductase [Amycolatopsis taiwanensis]|uniref:3-ketoacyl-ACP reductase n=1 Tax=Amycolatopsis taiwanensis TaxID=342230 RepID=A0A9W6VE58_9PSEU|nr:mycofactocin-coupled SDR family oxidoreductase [Amycolatopsis taiwanensis]GLY65435.1 3-ketoacyl-ACP reductase [Amycolatopsis taiwanensis]